METVKRPRALMQNDWISRLPDDLLIRILSILSTKEAAQTCLLSKRWKTLWADLPILKFNVEEFGVPSFIGINCEASRKSLARFDQFVSGVMENLKSTHLDRVYYVHRKAPAYFNKDSIQWLDRVALLKPQLIDISISVVESLELPDSLFSCTTLQHLKINIFKVYKTFVIPASINLPSLKVFDVADVELHENFPQNILMGCPSLETLNLSFCDLRFSSISSNMLKELHIKYSQQFGSIQISCPNLVSLSICTFIPYGGVSMSLGNMKFIKRAYFSLTTTARHSGAADVPVLNFLGGLSNATQLSLYIKNPKLKVPLERDLLNCKSFNNMKELLIGFCGISFDFNMVASLLKLSPNVEKLTLLIHEIRVAIHEEHMQEVLRDFLFQHKNIKTVKIRDQYNENLSDIFMKTLIKTLNVYEKEISNVVIE